MRKITVVTLFLLSACVTTYENGEPVAEREDRSNKQSRLERVHEQVAVRIERMKYQYDKELLGTVQELIGLEKLAIQPIRQALPDVDSRTRANLVYVLGFIGGSEARQLIHGHLSDPSEVVRYESAAALMQLGDWSAVPVLITFMESDSRRLRYKAHEILRLKTKQDFGYDFNADGSGRRESIEQWTSWWSGRRARLIYGNDQPQR